MNPQGTQERDFIWPDDPNFRSFPKLLPEDCVEYTIHVLDTSLHTTALRSRLLEIQRAADKLQKDLLRGYIWQREAFNLSLSEPFIKPVTEEEAAIQIENGEKSGQRTPLHLHGRSSYGDSGVDEWLIVYLLRELSKQFPSTWLRVWDSDGEFLLIEAANTLPRWVNPEVAENRVWMQDAKLYIIPLKSKTKSSSTPAEATAGLARNITVSQALEYLLSHDQSPQKSPLLYSPAIEKEAFHRIRAHPSAIKSNLHTSVTTIPRKLCYLLDRNPAWVSAAVDAFYLRDPISLKPLQQSAKDMLQLLILPPQDFVDVPVKFTRVGFAQLRGQVFPAPTSWANVDYKSKSANLPSEETISDKKIQQRREIGMKLTCGFEMLVSDPANKNERSVREMQMLLSDLQEGEEELPSDEEIQQWHEERGEDGEEWLDVNFEDFERELRGETTDDNQQHSDDKAAQNGKTTADAGFGDKDAQENLRRMVQRFEDFLKDEDRTAEDEARDSDIDEMDFDNVEDDNDDYNDNDDDENAEDSEAEQAHSPSESAEEEAEYNEEQLQEMIREMKAMGLKPPAMPDFADDEIKKALLALTDFDAGPAGKSRARFPDFDPHFTSPALDPNGEPDPESEDEASSDDGEDEDVAELARAMESELRRSGALDLAGGSGSGSSGEDPRYALAKHLLESYKGQAGMSGPAGNLMGALGVRMQRDEDEGGGNSRRIKK